MMRILITLIISSLFCFHVNAQSTFGKIFRSKNPFPIYNGSHATFLQTVDSALLLIYIVNDTTPGTNLCLIKLTNDGQVIWEKYLPLTTDMERLSDAVQMPDNTINILCTYDISNLIYDEEVYFVKIDLDGNLLNTDFQTSSGICCWDVADGRLNLNLKKQLLYTRQSYGISFSNGVVQLADTNYNYLFGAIDNNTLYHAAVFQDADSSYLSFGHESVNQAKRASLIKRNKQFTFQWQKLFRHSTTATNKLTIADDAIRVDSSYLLLMHFEDTLAFNNIYIVKTNLNGDSITSAKILSTSLPFGIYSLGNDGYLMASSNVSNNSYSNLELTRLDTAFQVTGTRQYRYKNFNERCFSFKTAYDGTFLVAASADSVFNRNIHILKIKPDLCVDPVPSFTINYNTGYGPGVSGIIINNTSDYGIADSINTTAMIYFGDGDSADFFVDSLSHIYPGQGTYTITVVITTPCGTQSYSQLVVVPCSGQPSSFTYTSNLLTINTGYNFSGSFYNWDFGDGGTANTQTATHTYGSSGTYYVCLSTTNSCGNIQICDSVTVDCTAPVIPFLPVAKACIGSTISIDAGSPGSNYLWSNGLSTQVAGFSTAGVYTVTVTNNCGVSATASVDVQFNAFPSVNIGPDSIICLNDQVILSNLFPGNNYTYQWFRNDVFQSSGTNFYFTSSNPGLFHFTLVADNDGCVDSISRNISVNPGLFCDTVSYCLPTYNTGTTQGDYIKRVGIGTLNNITGGIGEPGYIDYTALTTILNAGQSVTLVLDFNEVNSMYYKVWIDYNQDGIFTNTEVLSSNAVNPGLTTVFTSISANAYGGPTRMRVRCADSPTSNMDPCANYGYGQAEDYTLLINNGVGAPVINFTADTTHIYINGVVNFTDLSFNNPNAWEWTFTGAVTNTSTLKNPSGIIYPTPGCYPVTLKAYNANGFNTKTDTCYIFVDLSLSQQDNIKVDRFSINPNPFNDRFILTYDISENATLEIFDVTGRNILSHELQNKSMSKEIDLSAYHPGIYIIKIWNRRNMLFKSTLIRLE